MWWLISWMCWTSDTETYRHIETSDVVIVKRYRRPWDKRIVEFNLDEEWKRDRTFYG